MVRRVITVLCIGAMCAVLASCGQTYELDSITVSTTLGGTSSEFNIEGVGNTQQVIVTAHYSNTKTADVTVHSTFELGASADQLAPLTAVTVNNSGILQVVNAACTWHATPTNSGDTTFAYTFQPYTLTVTYGGKTATGVVNVDSEGGCYDGITFSAPSGFAGN